MKSKSKSKILIVSAITVIFIIGCATIVYMKLYRPNFNLSLSARTKYVYIYDNNKDFTDLIQQLRDSVGCGDIGSFEILASLRGYKDNIKSGRYAVEPEMSNYELLNRLRSGQQAPIKLTFINLRLLPDLTDRIAEQLMLTSNDLLKCLSNSNLCDSLGFNTATIATMFIPNTYEVYWNTSAEKLILRMKREYDTFWNDERRKKAAAMRLSPIEVSILASIIEEETAAQDEYATIAGLYIHRLHKGMLLQACPTVKFAVGDFTIRRILNKHLEVDSPYNTYLHAGLPPGPIRIPSPKTIDAVLNYEHHNYLYMCAKEDFSGRHSFAVTSAEHYRNAKKIHNALDINGIR
jgi:UPF0755 protein